MHVYSFNASFYFGMYSREIIDVFPDYVTLSNGFFSDSV